MPLPATSSSQVGIRVGCCGARPPKDARMAMVSSIKFCHCLWCAGVHQALWVAKDVDLSAETARAQSLMAPPLSASITDVECAILDALGDLDAAEQVHRLTREHAPARHCLSKKRCDSVSETGRQPCWHASLAGMTFSSNFDCLQLCALCIIGAVGRGKTAT